MTVAAIILAAGRSSRMGTNKLLETLGDRPLVAHCVDAALSSTAERVVVVTGHEESKIRTCLGTRAVTYVANPNYAEGLSTSLKAGLAALPPTISGALIVLGDMPLIDHHVLDRLIAAFDTHPDRAAIVPVYDGEWGNPVLLARSLFAAVGALEGDAGARKLLNDHRAAVLEVSVETRAVLIDLDTPEALAKARG